MTRTLHSPAGLLSDRLAELRGIDLDSLVDRAALQTRVDRKYVLRTEQLLAAMAEIGESATVLEIDGLRQFEYHSMYFDTPNLDCFRDHRQGRRRRFKVRTRHYVDSGSCMLEVKAPDSRGRTVKHRAEHPAGDRLTDAGWSFLHATLPPERFVESLRPSLATDYRRITLLDVIGGGRVTIDTGLRFVIPGGSQHVSDHTPGAVRVSRTVSSPPDVVIVETKAASGVGAMDGALRLLGIRPVSISKYCIGIALAHPDIAANRWHHLLRRHFTAPQYPDRYTIVT